MAEDLESVSLSLLQVKHTVLITLSLQPRPGSHFLSACIQPAVNGVLGDFFARLGTVWTNDMVNDDVEICACDNDCKDM